MTPAEGSDCVAGGDPTGSSVTIVPTMSDRKRTVTNGG
jgi:hypothetical protein